MEQFIDQQLLLAPERQAISMTPDQIAFIMGHDGIAKLIILNNVTYQLDILGGKARELQDRNCTEAYNAVNTLVNRLSDLRDNFNDDKIDHKGLKLGLSSAIKEARPELEKHRGYKEILANIALCILGLGLGYLAVCAYKGSFFKFNTDSADKLNELETSVGSVAKTLQS